MFQAEHRDLYGLQEFGQVGWECPQQTGTYHLNEERVLVERDGDGALVMTNLVTAATRIVRYRPADRADVVAQACACGRTLRRLAGIQGRQRGLIIDRETNPANVKPLRQELEKLPVSRWQVRQEAAGAITVALVPDGAGARIDREALSGRYARLMNLDSVSVEVVPADDLMTERGKAPQFRLYATQERYAAEIAAGG